MTEDGMRIQAEDLARALEGMDRVRQIDSAVWAAHCSVDLALNLDLDPTEWAAYVEQLKTEARGYWHGLTGRVFDRLGLTDDDWMSFVRIHRPEPAECLGDSSLDLFQQITLPLQICGESTPTSTPRSPEGSNGGQHET